MLSGAALLLSGTELSEEQLELVEVMQSGVKSMTSLIADMLVLSRLDAGRFPLELAPVAIRKGIVDQALRMIELHQQQRGVAGILTLTKSVGASVPDYCVADPARCMQILLNRRVSTHDRGPPPLQTSPQWWARHTPAHHSLLTTHCSSPLPSPALGNAVSPTRASSRHRGAR